MPASPADAPADDPASEYDSPTVAPAVNPLGARTADETRPVYRGHCRTIRRQLRRAGYPTGPPMRPVVPRIRLEDSAFILEVFRRVRMRMTATNAIAAGSACASTDEYGM